MRTYNYFELQKGKVYLSNLDNKEFKGKFEYKVYRHYLVYRHREKVWDYEKGRYKVEKWKGVWNSDWYNDTKASYLEIK
jgi:hypothetical protein